MNNLDTIIDFGSKNLRLGVFNQSSEKVYSSNIKINEVLENNNLDNALKNLVRDAEKQLSTHLADVNILYDSSEFNFIDFSIKKSFDQPTLISKHYKSLIEEANFIISENNFRDQVIHIDINNIIVDENRKLENLFDDIKIKSLILEIKFICLKKSTINNLSNKFKKNNLNILCIYCSSYVKSFFYKKSIDTRKNIIFLDIGYETTSALFFNNNKFQFLNSVPIGGNNITKDISKVLKLNVELSEKIKSNLNSDIIFSENEQSTEIFEKEFLDTIKEKGLSLDLIKKIIYARIEETLNLSFKAIDKNVSSDAINQLKIILIGQGSKILDNKYIDMAETTPLIEEIDFYEESTSNICESGLKLFEGINTQEVQLVPKKHKNKGLFERLFYFFK